MKPIDNFFRQKEQEMIVPAGQLAVHWQQFSSAQVLNEFYGKLAKPVQVFTISSHRDKVIVGKEGTRLRIPAECFQHVTGDVQIQLQEFYWYADMIACRLSMRSNDRQLVSGGMLYLNATKNGESLTMAPGKTILLTMPTGNFDERMMLFNGEYEHGLLNWLPAGQQQKAQVVATGDAKTNKAINAEGWISANKLVRRMYWLPVKASPDNEQPQDPPAPPSLEDAVKWVNRFQSVKTLPKSLYRFNLSKTGWINCDRYLEDAGGTVSLTVHINNELDAPIVQPQLIIDRYPSIIYGETTGNTIRFSNVPANELTYLLLTGVKNGEVVRCLSSVNPSTTEITDLLFEPVTAEAYKDELHKLYPMG